MAKAKVKKYLLMIEWENPFASGNNKGVLLYRVHPKNTLDAASFEAQLSQKIAPAINDISTRAIQYTVKYVLFENDEKEMDVLHNHQVRNAVESAFESYKVDGSFLVLQTTEASTLSPATGETAQ